MTLEETVKVLAILNATYRDKRYSNMSVEEAQGTATAWAIQFYDIPAEVVLLAVSKYMGDNKYFPAICEIKKTIVRMYWECEQILNRHKKHPFLSEEKEALYKTVFSVASRLRNKPSFELSVEEIAVATKQVLGNGNIKLLIGE